MAEAAGDMETVRSAVIAPAVKRSEAQAAEIKGLKDKVGEIDKRTPRERTRAPTRKVRPGSAGNDKKPDNKKDNQ